MDMLYKILFVDDDENILAGYRRHLRKNFDVHTTSSGSHGLELIKDKGPFHVVVSDLKMPDMDGFFFLSKVNKRDPHTICIMLTGFAELKASLKAFNEGYIFRFLTKPCKIETLESTIKDAVEKFAREREIEEKQNLIKTDTNFKRILVVDEDEEELTLISSVLNSQENMEVLTAENIDIAESLIGMMKTNLILISSLLAKKDDYSFLKRLKAKYQDTAIGIITWHYSSRLKKELKSLGIDKIFEKPLDYKNLYKIINEEFYSGPKGIIDGISISTFLQMIEMEEKTCTLKIKQGPKEGVMYFSKGYLIDALYNGTIGKEAAYDLIGLEKAEIEIENYCHKSENLIKTPLMSILMEAAKRKDHGE